MKAFLSSLSRSKRYVVAELLLVYFAQGLSSIMLGSVLPDLRTAYALDYQIGGTLLSAQSIGYLGIGLLSGVLSAALVNNTIGIIVTCPIAKEIGSKYGIAPKRLASLVDIFACAFLALMPHDGGILIVTELAGCTPLEVLPYSFYMFALIIFTCVTIHFGLLRTPEEKAAAKQEASAR